MELKHADTKIRPSLGGDLSPQDADRAAVRGAALANFMHAAAEHFSRSVATATYGTLKAMACDCGRPMEAIDHTCMKVVLKNGRPLDLNVLVDANKGLLLAWDYLVGLTSGFQPLCHSCHQEKDGKGHADAIIPELLEALMAA